MRVPRCYRLLVAGCQDGPEAVIRNCGRLGGPSRANNGQPVTDTATGRSWRLIKNIDKQEGHACVNFEWDRNKERQNREKHGLDFTEACQAFRDPFALVRFDSKHSTLTELRLWLIGRVGSRVVAVRYAHRPRGVVRIIGAGCWSNASDLYEEHCKTHRPETDL
jgi:uncharacterized DUF497 family protein